jgi:hypothetical protein
MRAGKTWKRDATAWSIGQYAAFAFRSNLQSGGGDLMKMFCRDDRFAMTPAPGGRGLSTEVR